METLTSVEARALTEASGFICEIKGIPIDTAPAALKAAVEMKRKFLLVTGLESDKFAISY